MRICLVYDLLYPQTVGGAERWYRNLALRLAAQGHEVTYLTMRHWDSGKEPDLHGVRVIAVAPEMPMFAGGRRRIRPPLTFGLGVLRHLVRNGRNYDVVHTASFPYFSLLAAACARPLARYRLVVEWHEFWTREYWREYLGPIAGRVGWRVQRVCLGVPQRAFCFSRLVQKRLLVEGVRGEVTLLEGEFEGTSAFAPVPAEPLVVFAGRHIPEKNPVAVVHAVVKARHQIPELRAAIYGDGPERPAVLSALARQGLDGVVEAPGFVDEDVLEAALEHALCLVLPSRREGYGLVVLEAISRGTPAIVVDAPDNAATELIEDGVNGFVVEDDADAIGEAIARVERAGFGFRETTLNWFKGNARRLALETSLGLLEDAYRNG